MYVLMDTKKIDTFGWVEWLIATREKKGWTQSDLARASGVTRQTINDYESRRRVKPDIEMLWKISKALGYPDDFLPRLAGLLPAAIELDESAERIIQETSDLTPQEKEEVLAFINMKRNLRKKK